MSIDHKKEIDIAKKAALKAGKYLRNNKIKLNHPLELLVFSNEEGGVFGSRALAGN